MRVTKLDAATCQLKTAIGLFFDSATPISTFTLAHASWEVLDTLCRNRGLASYRSMVAGSYPHHSEAEIRDIVTYGKNFMKHADRDPDDILNFSDTLNDEVLFCAANDFGALQVPKPIEIQLYPLWYLAAHSERAPQTEFEYIRAAAEKLFPSHLCLLDRPAQKTAGLEALQNARRLVASGP